MGCNYFDPLCVNSSTVEDRTRIEGNRGFRCYYLQLGKREKMEKERGGEEETYIIFMSLYFLGLRIYIYRYIYGKHIY